MVNVFGDSVGNRSGNLQVVKKVVETKGKCEDYWNEIGQSYALGFTPYRLNTICHSQSLLCWKGICSGRCCHDGGW